MEKGKKIVKDEKKMLTKKKAKKESDRNSEVFSVVDWKFDDRMTSDFPCALSSKNLFHGEVNVVWLKCLREPLYFGIACDLVK